MREKKKTRNLSYLLVEKDEIHLDEDESHLKDGPHDREEILAIRLGVHVELEEHADLDPGVDHGSDPEN